MGRRIEDLRGGGGEGEGIEVRVGEEGKGSVGVIKTKQV